MEIQICTQNFKHSECFPTCFFQRKPLHEYQFRMSIVHVHQLSNGAYLHYTTSVTGVTYWYVSKLPF